MGFFKSLVDAWQSINFTDMSSRLPTEVMNRVGSDTIKQFFYPEQMGALRDYATVLQGVMDVIFGIGILLIVCKVVQKGFTTYILGDNDPGTDPIKLLVKMVQAVALAVGFKEILYWLFYQFTLGTYMLCIQAGIAESIGLEELIKMAVSMTISPFWWLVFIAMYLILWISIFMRSFQLWILRAGFPFACVGIIDSDYGVFRPYVKKFFQASLTILTQMVLLMLGTSLVSSGHLIYGTCSLIAAFTMPKVLQEFFLFSGGGGAGNKIYGAVRIFDMVRSIVK